MIIYGYPCHLFRALNLLYAFVSGTILLQNRLVCARGGSRSTTCVRGGLHPTLCCGWPWVVTNPQPYHSTAATPHARVCGGGVTDQEKAATLPFILWLGCSVHPAALGSERSAPHRRHPGLINSNNLTYVCLCFLLCLLVISLCLRHRWARIIFV